MDLHQDRLCRHLPVHAECLGGTGIAALCFDTLRFEEALSLRSNGSRGVQRLEFDTDEVSGLPFTHRHEAVIDAATRDVQFPDQSQLVSRLMLFEKMCAVMKHLTAFQKASRADHNGLRSAS